MQVAGWYPGCGARSAAPFRAAQRDLAVGASCLLRLATSTGTRSNGALSRGGSPPLAPPVVSSEARPPLRAPQLLHQSPTLVPTQPAPPPLRWVALLPSNGRFAATVLCHTTDLVANSQRRTGTLYWVVSICEYGVQQTAWMARDFCAAALPTGSRWRRKDTLHAGCAAVSSASTRLRPHNWHSCAAVYGGVCHRGCAVAHVCVCHPQNSAPKIPLPALETSACCIATDYFVPSQRRRR